MKRHSKFLRKKTCKVLPSTLLFRIGKIFLKGNEIGKSIQGTKPIDQRKMYIVSELFKKVDWVDDVEDAENSNV